MGVDAAEIGEHEGVGDDASILFWDAVRYQEILGESFGGGG